MYALLLAILFLMGDPEEVAAPPSHPFSEEIFTRLEAVPDECLRGVERKFGQGADVDCAFPDIKRKLFLEAWQTAFPDDVAFDRVISLTSWIQTLGGWYRRYFEVDGMPTIVTYGGLQPGLVVAYLKRYPKCPGADEGMPRAGQDGVSRPQRLPDAWTDAIYPMSAKNRRLDGMVLLRAVIDEQGNTKDLCVLDVQPRGYGFAGAAVEAIKSFRYEPALRNGRAVEVQQPIAKTFEID